MDTEKKKSCLNYILYLMDKAIRIMRKCRMNPTFVVAILFFYKIQKVKDKHFYLQDSFLVIRQPQIIFVIKEMILLKSQNLCTIYGGHFVLGHLQGHGHILHPGNILFWIQHLQITLFTQTFWCPFFFHFLMVKNRYFNLVTAFSGFSIQKYPQKCLLLNSTKNCLLRSQRPLFQFSFQSNISMFY